MAQVRKCRGLRIRYNLQCSIYATPNMVNIRIYDSSVIVERYEAFKECSTLVMRSLRNVDRAFVKLAGQGDLQHSMLRCPAPGAKAETRTTGNDKAGNTHRFAGQRGAGDHGAPAMDQSS